MKKLLVINLMLIEIICWSQVEVGRLDKWYVDFDWGVSDYYQCYYSEADNQLDSIVYYLIIGNDTSTRGLWYYSNDTLLRHDYINGEWLYNYTEDTVYKVKEDGQVIEYDINEENQWLNNGRNTWSEGNCVDRTISYITHHEEFRNPWLHISLYLRLCDYSYYSNGSYNLYDTIYDYSSSFWDSFEVLNSIGEWPTVIKQENYVGNSEIFNVEYHDWIYVKIPEPPETSSKPYRVLRVDYFDLMGRNISKPERGFYIEREVTNKGVICRKICIQ